LADGGSHIFICFSSRDEAVAREIVDYLEAGGQKCWISLRDVAPGHNYQEAIVQALESARGIVFLFSDSSSKSGEIKKELSIGGSINVPVFPVRLDSVVPTGALRYELATRQWVDLFPDRQRALGKLAETIKLVIDVSAEGTAAPVPLAQAASAAPNAAPPHAPIVAAGTPGFETIRALLARHIGPIAKVYVQKAAAEARSPDDFCERLAAHVAAPADRASFRKAVQAQLMAKS
jgi:hypothetical protein